MQKMILSALLCTALLLPIAKSQESAVDYETIPQALAHFIAGDTSACEALISSSISPEDWTATTGLLLRAKNLVYLGAYAKEQDDLPTAQSIGSAAVQLLDTAAAGIPEIDTDTRILELKIRAAVAETLIGNSEQAEQLSLEAAALEPPPTEEPMSPPE